MSGTDLLRSFAESREHDAIIIKDGITYGEVRDALQELTALRAEVDRPAACKFPDSRSIYVVTLPNGERWACADVVSAEIERLRARVAELEQDAARYRWLRDNCNVWGSESMMRSDIQVETAALWLLGSVDLRECGINAAIDAAMRKD